MKTLPSYARAIQAATKEAFIEFVEFLELIEFPLQPTQQTP
jgi:hypothetical protein